MKNYRGKTRVDIPFGAGSFVDENEDGGEVYNFYPMGKKYYGFARIQGDKSIRLTRLGATNTDEKIDNVTVVFFAKNKLLGGGQYIVGWYKNAILFKNTQLFPKSKRNYHPWYNCMANIKDSYLVKEEDRTVFELPDDGPGQSNVWYVEEYHDKKFLEQVKKYISNPKSYKAKASQKRTNIRGWQQDAEQKKRVELAAMKAVEKYFISKKFAVSYRHQENLGWDMEATLGKTTLLLEVKGLSGDFYSVDLTHNEYSNTKRNKKYYRICIVSNALNKAKQKVEIYYHQNGKWINEKNEVIKAIELVSARFEKDI
jgi:hypothetical protein